METSDDGHAVHPLLTAHETGRPEDRSVVEHEAAWDRASELREVLEEVRTRPLDYANLLVSVAGVEPLIALDERTPNERSGD